MMRLTLSALMLTSTTMFAGAALAQEGWVPGPSTIDGSIRAGSREGIVAPGDTTQITGARLTPAQTIQVMHGTELLTPEPVTVDPEGRFSFEFTIPENAEPGNYPLTVLAANPAGTALVDLKLSQEVPLSGEEAFTLDTVPALDRSYQAALSQNGNLFVAAARGDAGPGVLKLNADTLEEAGRANMPVNAEGEPYGAYGIGVDDAHGNIWVSETMAGTAIVFNAEDLSVVKVFPEDSIGHPRDVVIDETANRAYINDALTGRIHVFDTETLEELDPIQINTADGRDVFASMTLALDTENKRLYTVSRETPWVGWVDLESGESTAVEVPEISGGSGIARDAETGRLYVASQNSDNLVVLDSDGEVIADTVVGAGALSVAFEPVSKQVFVASRAAGTLTVLDADGKIVANLDLGDAPNQVIADGEGEVFAVAMFGARDDDDTTGSISRVTAN